MILEVQDLHFAYKTQKVLKNINFSLEKGKILAILGPNGAGKTTLLKCINSILKRDKGSILIDGKDTKNLSITDIARLTSYVSQNSEIGNLTAFDAILLGRTPHINWKVSTEDIKKVDSVIKKLNLEHLSLKNLNQMSGGELQKISIARAFVQETKLFLLDEPTSNLDLKNQIEVLELIKRVVKEHNVSAIMTMHDINTALQYSDKYIFLKEGEVYEEGKVEDISKNSVEEVYKIRVELVKHNGFTMVFPSKLLTKE